MKLARTLILWSLVLGFSSIHAATKIQKAGLEYRIDKTPAWVQKVADPSPAAALADDGPTRVLLEDSQINLLGPQPTTYTRMKTTARERSGLEAVSNIHINFNPRYEILTLHDLAILRDGKRMDKLKTARVDLAQREAHLEQGIYDEDVTAIVALDDVRVGDVVEYAFSVEGENPVFAGKFSRFFGLNRDAVVDRRAIRILSPSGRKLHLQVYQSPLTATTAERGNTRIVSLNADNLARVRPEQNVPSWFSMYPFLEVTEYESWEQVKAWMSTLYKVPSDLSPELEQKVQEIRAAAPTPLEQAALALATVQNDIRYYSVAVGASSHRPNHPNVTFRQRFGDCKDKSVLLSALLQKLGISAEPALVSNQFRRSIANWLPNPIIFDHVIVRAVVDGKVYWLDGTRILQGSNLATLGFSRFDKALVADTASAGLADVVAPPQLNDGSDYQETFSFSTYGGPAVMKLEARYSGRMAEWLRSRIAERGLKNYVDALQTDYGRDFPNLTLAGEATITDDLKSNVAVFSQAFNIPKLFVYDNGVARLPLYASSLIDLVRFPRTPSRQFPLALPYPGDYTHRIVLQLPNKINLPAGTPDSWRDRHATISTTFKMEQDKLITEYRFRPLTDTVAPADFPAYSEKSKQGAQLLFSSLSLPLTEPPALRTRLIKEFEKARVNFRDPDQAESLRQKFLRQYVIADEAIQSKLIAGPVLAKAYLERGTALSQLGRRDEALADADRALALDANEEAALLKAEIQIYLGRYAQAREALNQVNINDAKDRVLSTQGLISYYLGDYTGAQSYFAKAAAVSTDEELPHILIWLAIAAKRAGQDPSSAVQGYRSRLSSAWPADGVSAVLGEIDAQRLLQSAQQNDREDRMRLCEAYFYLGQKALLAGDTAEARRWFKKTVDTDVIIYREHIFAQQELQLLGKSL